MPCSRPRTCPSCSRNSGCNSRCSALLAAATPVRVWCLRTGAHDRRQARVRCSCTESRCLSTATRPSEWAAGSSHVHSRLLECENWLESAKRLHACHNHISHLHGIDVQRRFKYFGCVSCPNTISHYFDNLATFHAGVATIRLHVESL